MQKGWAIEIVISVYKTVLLALRLAVGTLLNTSTRRYMYIDNYDTAQDQWTTLSGWEVIEGF